MFGAVVCRYMMVLVVGWSAMYLPWADTSIIEGKASLQSSFQEAL